MLTGCRAGAELCVPVCFRSPRLHSEALMKIETFTPLSSRVGARCRIEEQTQRPAATEI